MRLPWPEVKVPEYKPFRHGRWSLDRTFGCMPGYFTYELHDCDVPALKRRENSKETVWMSLAWMERESHMPHIAAAHGNVVVMGLGMGMYLYNIIQKPEVETVTVVERDASVLALLHRITNFLEWPGNHKVRFVHDDARRWKPGNAQVDFMYADFWKRLGDRNQLTYTKQCVYNVRPKSFGYWTQEFDFISWIIQRRIKFELCNAKLYNEWASSVEDSTGSRIIGRDDDGYAVLCAIANVLQTLVTFRENPIERMIINDRLRNLYSIYHQIGEHTNV